MFIVTAQMVKPVNRDELPAMPNVESLKKGSLLGTDRTPGQIDGPTGFSLKSGAAAPNPETPNSTVPATPVKEPAPAAAPPAGNKSGVPSVSLVQPAADTTPEVNVTRNP
jgi:hypothetical protein